MVGILLSKKLRVKKNILQKKLFFKGIDTRSFFMSMNEQPCFKEFKVKKKNIYKQ